MRPAIAALVGVAVVLALGVAFLLSETIRVSPRTAASAPNWTNYGGRVAPMPIRLKGMMTRAEVIAVVGLPDEVFRKNRRAECWAYTGPYKLRLCFGAKRRLAWWAGSPPPSR